MRLKEAQIIAGRIRAEVLPYCEIIEVAGSIRRECPDVGDIEIVAVPKWEQRRKPNSLFEDLESVNLLHEHWATARALDWIQPGTSKIVPVPTPAPTARYWRGLVGGWAKVDIFLPDLLNYGWILMIRTGCADFSQAMVTLAARRGTPSIGGWLTRDGVPIPVEWETDAFAQLGLSYIEPPERDERAAQSLFKKRPGWGCS